VNVSRGSRRPVFGTYLLEAIPAPPPFFSKAAQFCTSVASLPIQNNLNLWLCENGGTKQITPLPLGVPAFLYKYVSSCNTRMVFFTLPVFPLKFCPTRSSSNHLSHGAPTFIKQSWGRVRTVSRSVIRWANPDLGIFRTPGTTIRFKPYAGPKNRGPCEECKQWHRPVRVTKLPTATRLRSN